MAGFSPADQQAPASPATKGTGVFVPRDNSTARHRMLQARARSTLPTDSARCSRGDSGETTASMRCVYNQICVAEQQDSIPYAWTGSTGFSSSIRSTSDVCSYLQHSFPHSTPVSSESIDFQFSEPLSAVSASVLVNSQAPAESTLCSGHYETDLPLQSPGDFWSFSGPSSPLSHSLKPAASINSISSELSCSDASNGSLAYVDALREQLMLLQKQDKLLQEKEQSLIMQQKLLQRLGSSAMAVSQANNMGSTGMRNISVSNQPKPWSQRSTLQHWQGRASCSVPSSSTMMTAVPAALAGSAGNRAAAVQLSGAAGGRAAAALHLSRSLSASVVPISSSMGGMSYSYPAARQGACHELPTNHHKAAAWPAAAFTTTSMVKPAVKPAVMPAADGFNVSFDMGAPRTCMAAKLAQLAELRMLQQAIQQDLLQLLC